MWMIIFHYHPQAQTRRPSQLQLQGEISPGALRRARKLCHYIGMETQLQRHGQELLRRGLSVLHESLADWILINPGGTLRDMGAHFGYSPAWLCTVLNSDMFKAYMQTRRKDIIASIAASLPEKLEAAAHLATERIIEVVQKSEDGDQIIDAFDRILHRYGYAPNAKNGAQQHVMLQQNNVFYLSREDLMGMKGKLVEAHAAEPAVEPPQAPPAPALENLTKDKDGELMPST